MLGKTVGEMLDTMDSEELSGWLAFEEAYGIPDVYFQTGILSQTIAGAMTGESPSIGDFIPYFREVREVTLDDSEEAIREESQRVQARLSGLYIQNAT